MQRRWSARSHTIAVALGFVLTLEVLRAWAPFLPYLKDARPEVPLVVLGVAAVAAPVLALAVIVVGARGGPSRLGALYLSGAAFLALLRIAVQSVHEPVPQGLLATGGLAAGLVFVQAATVRSRPAALGLIFGLTADALLRSGLQTFDLVWRQGAGGWVGTLVVLALFGFAVMRSAGALSLGARFAARRSAEGRSAGTDSPGDRPVGFVWGWLAVGPVVFLHLVIAAQPSRLAVNAGVPYPVAIFLVAFAYTAAALVVARRAGVFGGTPGGSRLERGEGHRRSPQSALRPIVTVFLMVGASGMILPDPLRGAVSTLLLPFGLLLLLDLLLLATPGASPARRASGMAGGFVACFFLALFYYLGFDAILPFPNAYIPAATGAVLAVLVYLPLRADVSLAPVAGGEADPAQGPEERRGASARPSRAGAVLSSPAFGLAAAAIVALLVSVPAGRADPVVPADHGFPLRVATYNVFMGLGTERHQDLSDLATAIESEAPDVVALQEVSRGWLLTGGADLLPLLANRTGMQYRFFPAADDIWGNAILTRYPILEERSGSLPRDGAAMRRSYGLLVLDVPGTPGVAVVATHLHHIAAQPAIRRDQAATLAGVVSGILARDLPVVLLGDLNAPADAPELLPLWRSLHDVLGPVAGRVATYPSWDPRKDIDHILASEGLTGSRVTVFGGAASDHLGVAATIAPTGPVPGRLEPAMLRPQSGTRSGLLAEAQ